MRRLITPCLIALILTIFLFSALNSSPVNAGYNARPQRMISGTEIRRYLYVGAEICEQYSADPDEPYDDWYFNSTIERYHSDSDQLVAVCGFLSNVTYDGQVDGRHGAGWALRDVDGNIWPNGCQRKRNLQQTDGFDPDAFLWDDAEQDIACSLCLSLIHI